MSMRLRFVTVSVLVVLATLAATATALGYSGPIFTVMNTSETLPDGVWFRNSPHTADTDRVTGHGVYMNEQVQLVCYAWGDAVGPYNNTLWYFALNVTRSVNAGVENSGYLNAHYINDGLLANQIDAGVPQCGAPPPPSPVVTLAQGPVAPFGYRYAVTLSGFGANASVSVTCFDSVSPNGFYTFNMTTDGAGGASTASQCYSADGPDHWVIASGISSNHVAWGGSSGSGSGGGTGGTTTPPPPTPTTINGVNVGYAQNQPHMWGSCSVQDFDGGPLGWVIVSYTNGTQIVKAGMLWGWFDNGGAPGFGCPTNQEHPWANGVRQDFTSGGLYWTAGMDHAKKVTGTSTGSVTTVTNSNWAGYDAKVQGVTEVYASWKVTSVNCGSASKASAVSAWVGIDNQMNHLVQAGTAARCDSKKATPVYYSWWESLPALENPVTSVKVGDTITVDISYSASQYKIVLTVNGAVQFVQMVADTSAPRSEAECIVEAPSDAQGVIRPLANFGTITFTE